MSNGSKSQLQPAWKALTPDASHTKLWLIALGLSLGPAASNGFARFAYGLMLPAMREDLNWTYTEAGWLNTANALGYLIGAALTLALIGRLGPKRIFLGGMIVTTLALLLSGITREFWLLSAWRILAGIAGAPVFISGGAMAATLFRGDAQRNALAIGLYFGGGGLGQLLTGASIPFMLEGLGHTIWPQAWLGLGLGTLVMVAPSAWALWALEAPKTEAKKYAANPLPYLAMAPALCGYFLFGLGYLIYLTFLVAWMREEGATASLIALVWSVMGTGTMLSPFLWRRVLAWSQGGGALAYSNLACGAGTLVALVIAPPVGVVLSAALVGASFYIVPTAATSFGRKNLDEAQWGRSFAAFTTLFSIGQMIGPVAAGALTDATSAISYGLAMSGTIVLLGALAAGFQAPLKTPQKIPSG